MLVEAGAQRLVDRIAEQLREKIYAGEYAPGDRLRQEQLAAELSVSRTPLREALRILERDGLVAVTPTRGVQVAPGERAHLLSAYEVREVIDGLAARLAAGRRSPSMDRQLSGHLECQEAALHPWNARLWTRMNVAFHCAIVEHAANPVLQTHVALIRLTAQVFHPHQLLDPGRAAQALDEHRAIAIAIAAGDASGAEGAARRHVHRTLQALGALRDERPVAERAHGRGMGGARRPARG